MSDDAGSPAERLLYALGQLYRLSRTGKLAVAPADIDALDIARVIDIAADIEFVTDGRQGRSIHFSDEVLVCNPAAPFPWELLDDESWALLEEFAELDLGT